MIVNKECAKYSPNQSSRTDWLLAHSGEKVSIIKTSKDKPFESYLVKAADKTECWCWERELIGNIKCKT